MLDEDGDPVTGLTCDSEVSKNGDTGVDCTNEATEIPFTTATNKGMYYLTLTTDEMTADIVAVTVYGGVTTAQATCIVLYPRKLVTLATGTSQGGAAGYITLAAGVVTLNGQYNGCLCVATIDTLVEARILQACTASNQQCTVTPSWNVAPDADDTYIIYLPEGMQIPQANVTALGSVAQSLTDLKDFADTGYDPSTHVAQTDLTHVHGSALTETGAGYLAGSFVKFFDKQTPTGTVNSLPDAVPGAASGLPVKSASGDFLNVANLPQVIAGAALGLPLKDANSFLAVANIPAVTAGATNGLALVGSVMGKSAATLAAADVTGNLPVDVKAYTVQPTVTGATLAADQAVNAAKIGGTTQTGRDIGASVLLSPGTGAGQLNINSGVVAASGNWNTATPLDAAGQRAALGMATANLDTQLSGITAPTAGQVADAVWDEDISSGHTGAGKAATVVNALTPGSAVNLTFTKKEVELK